MGASLLLAAAAQAEHGTRVEPGENTLQEAVAAAAPGDTLLLQPGLYLVSSTVLIDKDLTIKGSTGNPKDVHIAARTDEFEFHETEPPFDVETNRGHLLFACNGLGGCEEGATKVTLAYFTIKNAPESPPFDREEGACTEPVDAGGLGLNLTECFGDAIHADGVAEVVVRHVEASLNAGNGIFVNGATKAKFRDILAVNNGAFGIDVDTALDLSIRRSTFTANQISGLEASGHAPGLHRADYVADVEIRDTLAKGNGEIGIEVERFRRAKLKDVRSTDNREDGFDADRVSEVVISDSAFRNNLDDGLELFPFALEDPNEQPIDFPGSIIEDFDDLKFSGNVADDIDHAPTEN